jgi:hypothetical protein
MICQLKRKMSQKKNKQKNKSPLKEKLCLLEDKKFSSNRENEAKIAILLRKLEDKQSENETMKKAMDKLKKENVLKIKELDKIKEENAKMNVEIGQLQFDKDKLEAETKAKNKLDKIKKNTKLFNDIIA